MKKKKTKLQLPTSIVLYCVSFFVFFLSFTHCYTKAENHSNLTSFTTKEDKHCGAHVFSRLDSSFLNYLSSHNYDWITLVPYDDQENYNSKQLNSYNGDTLRSKRADSSRLAQINIAHTAGFKVFLKPHIWLYSSSDDKWRSDIFPSSDENWEVWKESYRKFILRNAIVAEKGKVELFCIGTELTRLSSEKPEFWRQLIQDVKSVYSGEITYAANWYEEYENITFWDELDYIGIQAYFPVSKNLSPTVNEISNAWQKHIDAVELVHKRFGKNVLFTELGYKSTEDSAKEPWKWVDYSMKDTTVISYATQSNCYEAFFKTVWKEDWFAGVHVWQLSGRVVKGRGKSDWDFYPQFKPAEKIIAKGFEGN